MTDEFPKFVSPMRDESLVLVTHPSAMNYLGLIMLSLLLVPVVVGIFMLLCIYIIIKTTYFVVTDKRVITKFGILSINQSEVRVADIRGVNLQRGLWQRVIGVGDITIGTAATDGAEIVMLGVGDPNQVVAAINSHRTN